MANDSSNHISYYLRLHSSYREHLGALRHWSNLKIGFDEDAIWLKDLSLVQMQSVEVKTLPFQRSYYALSNVLYPLGSRLPEGRTPSLLWTPIERGLPLKLPACHQYYGEMTAVITPRLVPSHQEREAFALYCDEQTLGAYITEASSIRMRHLRWILLQEPHRTTPMALLTGTPLLPLNGIAYWRQGSFLLPAGYDMDLPIVSNELSAILNPDERFWVLWFVHPQEGFVLLPKADFRPLTRSSYRHTRSSLLS